MGTMDASSPEVVGSRRVKWGILALGRGRRSLKRVEKGYSPSACGCGEVTFDVGWDMDGLVRGY